MKIFIITETLFEGGSETFVLRLARALLKKGVDVEVLSLNRRYENPAFTAIYPDVPVRRFHLPLLSLIEWADKMLVRLRINLSLKYSLQKRQLRKVLRKDCIVHSHYIQVDHMLAGLKKKLRFKHIVTVHGDYSAQFASFEKGELRHWLHLDKKLALLSGTVDHWVLISEEQHSFFKKNMQVPAAKISRIYNGYEKPATGSTPPFIREKDSLVIGMVSRGHKLKGWELLIRSFQQLPANARLLLIGESEYLDELKKQYAADTRISFTGFQSEPGQWLSLMDLFVLPTQFPFESLPNVITEALSFGIPVLATDVGEIRKMITDEKTGEMTGGLIQQGSMEVMQAELTEKLNYFYHQPELLEGMKKTALAAAVKFDMDICADAYLSLYKNVGHLKG